MACSPAPEWPVVAPSRPTTAIRSTRSRGRLQPTTPLGARGFAANEIDPLTVRFEELVADPVGMTREVLGFLDIDTDGVAITPLTLPTSV